MSDNTNTKSMCANCENSIRCETWAEWRCKVYEKRMYNHRSLTHCPAYKQRGKDFKEPKCQCEDCLKNSELTGESEE